MKAILFADWAINIFSKPKVKKDDFIHLANQLQLSSSGTVVQIKKRLNLYSSSLRFKYKHNAVQPDEIHFWASERQPSFETMVCKDGELIYTARKDVQEIVSFHVQKDSVGLRGVNMQQIIKYGH